MKPNYKSVSIVSLCIACLFMALSLSGGVGMASSSIDVKVTEVSEDEYNNAFSGREEYQLVADTVVSAGICGIVKEKVRERLQNMDELDRVIYDCGNINCDSCSFTILKFPFGLYATSVHATHEEWEYWFFDASDCEFVARTGMCDDMSCVSINGYMASVRYHNHDENVDVSFYRLRNGRVETIGQCGDVELGIITDFCWGADNTFYLRATRGMDYADPSESDERDMKCLRFSFSGLTDGV